MKNALGHRSSDGFLAHCGPQGHQRYRRRLRIRVEKPDAAEEDRPADNFATANNNHAFKCGKLGPERTRGTDCRNNRQARAMRWAAFLPMIASFQDG